jgi:hypothetical protein
MLAQETDLALLAACEAALAWVAAIERDDGSVNFDQLYWRWVHLMRGAVADARRAPAANSG